jgi:hypothetical protein
VKLRKIISGGQTGADRTGLECAKELGILTGGTAPKGYRTETGDDPTLKDFGVVESFSSSYPIRTAQNVRDSQVTLWFGNTGSPGYWCTKKACGTFNKPFLESFNLKALSEQYEVINIAGNRASTNPKVIDLVKEAFQTLV